MKERKAQIAHSFLIELTLGLIADPSVARA